MTFKLFAFVTVCINPDQIGFINLQSFSFTFYALCVLHKVSKFLMFLSMAEAFSAPRTSLDSDSFCINASWTLAQQPITQYMLLATFPFCFFLFIQKIQLLWKYIKSFKSLKRKFMLVNADVISISGLQTCLNNHLSVRSNLFDHVYKH